MIRIVDKETLESLRAQLEDAPMLVMRYNDKYIVCSMDDYRYMTTDIETYLHLSA